MAYRLSLTFFGNFCYLLCGLLCLQSQVQPRNTTQEEIQAEVGGQVRLPCRHQIQGNVTFMYMQRSNPPALVNGYHHEKDLSPDKMFANRTVVDQSLAWVDLWDVRVTDEGVYECVLMDESPKIKTLTLYLKVTANYSTPLVTVHCNESESSKTCMATCSSSGGYPNKSVTWDFQPKVAGTQWEEVKRSSMQNSITKLYNVSRKISINCSQPLKIRCTVGGVVSQQEEVCNTPRHVPFDWMVLAASAVAILFILVVVIMVKKDKACPATNPPEEETGGEENVPNTHLLEIS